MKRLYAIAAALVAALLFSGCRPLPVPTPGPGSTPTQAPMETPTPEPTVPPVVQAAYATRGHAVIHVAGLGELGFGFPQFEPLALDYWTVATLLEHISWPGKVAIGSVVEFSLRGNYTSPCLEAPGRSPCALREPHPLCDLDTGFYVKEETGRCWQRGDAGLWVRITTNMGDEQAGNYGRCGLKETVELNHRVPIGPNALRDGFDIDFSWDETGIRVAVIGGGETGLLHLKTPGSLALAYFEPGVPQLDKRNSNGFSLPLSDAVKRRGVDVKLKSWEVLGTEGKKACP